VSGTSSLSHNSPPLQFRHCGGQGTKAGDINGVGDGVVFELGVVWGDGDNNVGDFFVGDEFDEVFGAGVH